MGLFVDVFSGVPTSSPIDGAPTFFSEQTCAATVTGTALTVANPNEMVFAFATTGGSGPLTAGSGFTLYTGSAFTNNEREGMVATSAGSTSASIGGMTTASSGCTVETVAIK